LIEEIMTGEDDAENEMEVALTTVMIEDALTAILASVFPHRELAVQKPWMHHEMKKPRELSF
jgi:hypothetical protein